LSQIDYTYSEQLQQTHLRSRRQQLSAVDDLNNPTTLSPPIPPRWCLYVHSFSHSFVQLTLSQGGLLLCVIAIFLPPLAVTIRRGCGGSLLLNILLCCLAWIPGVFHAWYVILSTPSHSKRRRERASSHSRESSYSTGGSSRRSRDDGYHRPSAARTHYAPPPRYSQETGYTTHHRKY
jgi:uncharacterized membrane protein YqaE (UPF0057 family)